PPWPNYTGIETIGTGWYRAVALGGTINEDRTPGDIGGFLFKSYAVPPNVQLNIGTNGVLRLNPGNRVKLWPGAGITTSGGGELSAHSPGLPVTFTSYRDDSDG